MKKMIIDIWSGLIDLLFPPTCFCCNQRVKSGIICHDCELSLTKLENICSKCGAQKKELDCEKCNSNDFLFDKARSVFHFDKNIQALVHDLKYDEMTKAAIFLSQKTAEYLRKNEPFEKIDYIAPVPLHNVKKRARGFNQAELLTKEISRQMKWQHLPHLILRNRFTETQTKLGRIDRKENVSGAFSLNKKYSITNKNILIVDDVFTTGATVNSITLLLKNCGAGQVFVLTIARA